MRSGTSYGCRCRYFDDDLTPLAAILFEKAVGEPVKIIDRTALILISFACMLRRVRGAYRYSWHSFNICCPVCVACGVISPKEQTRGGIGSRFGQGESQLEVDRRLIRNKIAALRRELKQVEQRRDVQSKNTMSHRRFASRWPVILMRVNRRCSIV